MQTSAVGRDRWRHEKKKPYSTCSISSLKVTSLVATLKKSSSSISSVASNRPAEYSPEPDAPRSISTIFSESKSSTVYHKHWNKQANKQIGSVWLSAVVIFTAGSGNDSPTLFTVAASFWRWTNRITLKVRFVGSIWARRSFSLSQMRSDFRDIWGGENGLIKLWFIFGLDFMAPVKIRC